MPALSEFIALAALVALSTIALRHLVARRETGRGVGSRRIGRKASGGPL